MNILHVINAATLLIFLCAILCALRIGYRQRKIRKMLARTGTPSAEPVFQMNSTHPHKGGPFNFCKRGCC